jgi:pimeloyl-ACP methyl ester carboxylesterase
MADFHHHYVRLNELNYHFVIAGGGPAVLFLHGFPDLWLGWKPVMALR